MESHCYTDDSRVVGCWATVGEKTYWVTSYRPRKNKPTLFTLVECWGDGIEREFTLDQIDSLI